VATSFGEYLRSKKGVNADRYNDIYEGFGRSGVPSYDFYAEAADEVIPGYFVELAKSGRSQCVKVREVCLSCSDSNLYLYSDWVN